MEDVQNTSSTLLNGVHLLNSTNGSVVFLEGQTSQLVKIKVLQDPSVKREAVHLKFRFSLIRRLLEYKV